MKRNYFFFLSMLPLVISCGGAQQPETASEPHQDESESVADDGMTVEGIRGTLNRDEVDPVLNQAARRFQQCYIDAYMNHPYLAGDLAMQFTVAPDGSVQEVWTTTSTLGSREVEDCILNIARRLSFPRPRGGEAEFDYGPLAMNSDDGFPFEEWSLERLEEEQALAIQEAFAGCTEGNGGYSLTMYIGPGGRIRSAGAVAPTSNGQESARCLERELAALEYPDPGEGHIVKITLEL